MSTPKKLKEGQIFQTVFCTNTDKKSPFRFKAKRLVDQAKRAPKVMLCDDPRIQPGELCKVRVKAITKPRQKARGYIEVEFLGKVTFKIDASFYVDPVLEKKLQALLDAGMNILLDGPQGSGKTVLSQKLAQALGMEYVYFNCSSVYEPTDFLATFQVKESAHHNVVTEWVSTDVLRAIEAAHANPGRRYLVFLDEFNRCREIARNGVMPALDATRRMYNPRTGSTITIPDNVLWIAAINNGAQFTGTTTVDPAQLDRFAPVKMRYPPEKEEIRILGERYSTVPKTQIKRIVKAANAIRTDENLRVDLSMRASEEVCMLLSHPNFTEYDGDPIPELLKTSFCARFLGDWDQPATDSGLVWQCITRALEL
ncbi:MAG: MoxR family ATPase [Kiritimatiellae bacterium]|nr:MoxR family ATPase [Kiritimatiellia bacterium]